MASSAIASMHSKLAYTFTLWFEGKCDKKNHTCQVKQSLDMHFDKTLQFIPEQTQTGLPVFNKYFKMIENNKKRKLIIAQGTVDGALTHISISARSSIDDSDQNAPPTMIPLASIRTSEDMNDSFLDKVKDAAQTIGAATGGVLVATIAAPFQILESLDFDANVDNYGLAFYNKNKPTSSMKQWKLIEKTAENSVFNILVKQISIPKGVTDATLAGKQLSLYISLKATVKDAEIQSMTVTSAIISDLADKLVKKGVDEERTKCKVSMTCIYVKQSDD